MKLEGKWTVVARNCVAGTFETYVARDVEISDGVLKFVDDRTGQSIITNSRFFLTSIKGASA